MPIYEYHCLKCNAKFELLRRMRESDDAVECPECKSLAQRTIVGFCCRTKSGPMGDSAPAESIGSSCAGCSSSSCSGCGG